MNTIKHKSVYRESFGEKELQKQYLYLMKNRRIEVAMNYLKNNSKVLEVGCSFGSISYYMAKEKGCFVDAYEINKDRLILAKKNFQHKNIHYHQKDVLEIDKEDEYDAVVLLEVIEHIENPYFFLQQLFKLLKPGGSLILSTPNAGDYLQIIRNLRLYMVGARTNKASKISALNKVKYGDVDDHIYCWTWDTMFRLLNRVGFIYKESDIASFRSISFGEYHFFSGDNRILEKIFRPFCTNLIFNVIKH